MSTGNFQSCLKEVLKHEGGFVNHPKDPGGMTNLGVTKATYESYVGHVVTEQTMRSLTQTTVSQLYLERYWNKLRCDDIPLGLDLCVFDFGVNAGPGRSARFLQKMIGAIQDGSLGPRSIIMANEYVKKNGNDMAIEQFQLARKTYYTQLATFSTFGKGWLRRVNEITLRALETLK
jgi:lysozyme family protein